VKCKCSSDCSNCSIQQGMKFQVEVFPATLIEWVIQTIEHISTSAFVFELIGKILTIAELIVRNL